LLWFVIILLAFITAAALIRSGRAAIHATGSGPQLVDPKSVVRGGRNA